MDASRAKGTSLWLMPDGVVGARLAATVARLASRFGTEPFAPHVTLLAGLPGVESDVVARTADLAPSLASFRIDLDWVDGREEHFRCLFVHAGPGAALSVVHAQAARALGCEADPEFLPHLSLVYGRLDRATKERLAPELAPEIAVSFEVRALHVWRTEGRVAEWRPLGTWPLAPPR
jgi:2'-5' RNA ligase